jgi:hypothetical protein
MGGHSAWRKRVAHGGLAKEGTGGAIARHRPRMGRRGDDLKLNKKGNIAGGNPKKKKAHMQPTVTSSSSSTPDMPRKFLSSSNTPQIYPSISAWESEKKILLTWVCVCLSAFVYLQLRKYWESKDQ